MSNKAKRFWGVLTPRSATDIAVAAKQFEAMGFAGVWTTQIIWGPGFATLAAAAPSTKVLQLGTGVAYAFTRSPVETALMALDLDTISDGRAVLGIGSSARDRNEKWYGVVYGKPLDHLREVVEICRMVIERGHEGELGKFTGDYYEIDFDGFATIVPPARPSIPIYLTAGGPRAIGVAAEVADGVLGHPMWPVSYLRAQVTEIVARHLAQVGRPRSSFEINYFAYTTVNPDRERAIEDHRGTVAFYASLPMFRQYFTERGWGHVIGDVAKLTFADGRRMLEAIPDEMVLDFGIAGDAEHVRSQVDEASDIADALSLLAPSYFVDPSGALAYDPTREQEYDERLVNTIYSSSTSP